MAHVDIGPFSSGEEVGRPSGFGDRTAERGGEEGYEQGFQGVGLVVDLALACHHRPKG